MVTSISKRAAISLNDFDQKCEALKMRAFNLSDETESLALGFGVAVGQNSAKLWKANLTSFCQDLNPTGVEPSYMDGRQRKVLGADGKGAIGGAIRGGMMGGFAGAFGGAFFGAACGSFCEAVFG